LQVVYFGLRWSILQRLIIGSVNTAYSDGSDRMSLAYVKKMTRVYIFNLFKWINRHFLVTYPLIEDCARCRDCGRNVHDFWIPDELWNKVIESSNGVWCYDCFCNRADKKLGVKWRMELKRDGWEWYSLAFQ